MNKCKSLQYEIINEIIENKCIFCGTDNLSGSFCRVEKVSDKSNYYCLFFEKDYFYLYHAAKKQFALKSNDISNAHVFIRVEDYSENTKSFIVYRKGLNFIHIIYEDGSIEDKTYKYVGSEINGIRAVKTHNDRWFFYDAKERKHLFLTGKRGCVLYDGYVLGTLYSQNVYSIKHYTKGQKLVLKIGEKGPIYSKDFFESVECVTDNYFIAKLYGKDVFCVIKISNTLLPVGYYTRYPKYVVDNNLFVVLKGTSWCVIKNGREIHNCQWDSDNFIFLDKYILNRSLNSPFWNIFDGISGQIVPTSFKNIRVRIDNGNTCLLVDINNESNIKVNIADVESYSVAYITSLYDNNNHNNVITNEFPVVSKQLKAVDIVSSNEIETSFKEEKSQKINTDIEFCPSNIINCNENAFENDTPIYNEVADLKQNTLDTQKETIDLDSQNGVEDSNKDANFPNSIDFVIYVKNLKLANGKDSYLISNINCNNFKGKTFVIWIGVDENVIVLTESRRYKTHRVLCLMDKAIDMRIKDRLKLNNFLNKFYPIEFAEVSTIIENYSSLECVLSKVVDLELEKILVMHDNSEFDFKNNITKNVIISNVNQSDSNKDDTYKIESVIVSSEMNLDKKGNITNNSINQTVKYIRSNLNFDEYSVRFTYGDIPFLLKIGDEWSQATIFDRRKIRYRKNENIILILLDFVNDKIVSKNDEMYYHILGEGKDSRFDHSLGQNANRTIHDSIGDENMLILLFEKLNSNKIVLYDATICVSYTFVDEIINRRKVLVFKMKSLLRITKI